MVRAKFKLDEIRITRYGTEEMRTLILTPVYSNDSNSENYKFWKFTPQGKLELGTVNKNVWENFEIGEEYYLDISKVKKDE
jgi:hypothetical protein